MAQCGIPFDKPANLLIPAEGGTWREGIVFHPTLGHSAGHMSISIRSRGEEAIFSGDVMHNPIQVCRPEWNSTFCLDAASARSSRHGLLNYAADLRCDALHRAFPADIGGAGEAGRGRIRMAVRSSRAMTLP
ncbi:MBL fold metallo-hydrolase [Paraburkholderia sediminicola]|uniref:hypothetical protein n=1 Tax=Paraburkholderia sediminicola TaxID=458836 RepID=UPI0038BCF2AD